MKRTVHDNEHKAPQTVTSKSRRTNRELEIKLIVFSNSTVWGEGI